MLLNIAEEHLREPLRHVEACRDDKCADGCGFRNYDEWIFSPVTATEIAAAKAEEEFFKALTAGQT